MNRSRIRNFTAPVLLVLCLPAVAHAMGAADHDLARDMATTVYGVAYEKSAPTSCPPGAGGAGQPCAAREGPTPPGPEGTRGGRCDTSTGTTASGCPRK